ncbi:MAG TPA: TonB-dependent receptor, partial [Gemmatimonadaceae bacterium]|nr:TonB-dependent receptor [Gemmatimonadaceae bacterium]
MRALSVATLIWISALDVAGAQGTIRGLVRSARTGEGVAGATVLIVGTRSGTIADSLGAYALTGIPAGTVRVRARFIGYADAEQSVTIQDGEIRVAHFSLSESITTLGEVRSEAKATERAVFEERPNLGVTMLSGKVVSTIPRLGEPDVLRAAQMLPGVLARNDFTAGLNVRGGEADQNLILLDGYPIFNPFHLGGMFGTFIDGSIAGLELRTGGFPAPFGGRLSSVLDVTSAEENRAGVHGSGTLSMLATSGTVGSMFHGGKGTWMVAGRRTYADKVLGLFTEVALPYYFRDGVAHATYRPFRGTRISSTFYDGRDDLAGDLAAASDEAGGGQFRFFWGNRVAGITLQQQLTDSLVLEQRASYTIFRTALDLGDPDTGLSTLRLENQVRETGIGGSLEYRGASHMPSIGYELTRDDMVYTAGSKSAAIEFLHDEQHPTSAAAFVNDVWRPSGRLILEGGLRY